MKSDVSCNFLRPSRELKESRLFANMHVRTNKL